MSRTQDGRVWLVLAVVHEDSDGDFTIPPTSSEDGDAPPAPIPHYERDESSADLVLSKMRDSALIDVFTIPDAGHAPARRRVPNRAGNLIMRAIGDELVILAKYIWSEEQFDYGTGARW